MEDKKTEKQIEDWFGQTEDLINSIDSLLDNSEDIIGEEKRKELKEQLSGIDLGKVTNELKLSMKDIASKMKF